MITVNNKDKLEYKEGMTVKDVLEAMNYTYVLITVHVNDIYVPEEEYDTFKVPDNSNVMVFHIFHGG